MEQSISKAIFKHCLKCFTVVFSAGVFAGLFVAFFSDFPSGTLWSFSSFSSASIGFWMFSSSTIVLLSEKKITAGINAGLYVFPMFLITGIYKFIRSYLKGYNGENNAFDVILQILIYGIIPAIVCAVLGFVLWNGRRNTWLGKLFVLIPLIVIIIEMILMYTSVIIQHTMLFQALLDSICAITYFFVFRKAIFCKPIKFI